MFHLHAQFIIILYEKLKSRTYIRYHIPEKKAIFLSSFRHQIATQTETGCLLRASDRIHVEKEIKDKMSGFSNCEKSLHYPSAVQPRQDKKPQTRIPRALLKADTDPGYPQELPAYT